MTSAAHAAAGEPEGARPAGRGPGLALPGSPEAERQWRLLPAWIAVALALRASVALGGDFILHPDELMQYLEQAHRAVFGNGVMFWEQHFGGRSWIVPGFVAGLLWVLDKAGLGQPAVYVYAVKLAFCLLSLLVPWGAYRFARAALGEDSARFALVLTCLWPYLVVFAHKPLTEFVSTSLLFGALGLACTRPGHTARGALAAGALLALAGAVRMQYLPAALIFWLALCAARGGRWSGASAAGWLAAAALVGALETLTWGSPFRSYYVNFVYNVGLDWTREHQGLLFYLPRLLFLTAGGALVMLYALLRLPRRHAPVLCAFAAVLALHLLQPHKELRFLFLLLPLCLLVTGDAIALGRRRFPRALGMAPVASLASALLVLVSFNLVEDQWIHEEHSDKRAPIRYLFGQGDMFEAYLELSRLDGVKGVLHLDEPYHSLPGYYYLHHDVPLYDLSAFRSATEALGREDASELVSHVVARHEFRPLDGFLELGRGETHYYGYLEGVESVKAWVSNTPSLVHKGRVLLAKQRLGYKGEAEALPYFEFAGP